MADGYLEVEEERFDGGLLDRRLYARFNHADIRIDLQVDPGWETWAREYERDRTMNVEKFAITKPTPPDGGPAVDLLIQIMRVIIRAWTMDDTSKRFRMLELD